MNFAGKSVLVTGAASGIGFATAELFIRSGAEVFMADIAADRLEGARKLLTEGRGGRVVALRCDTSSPGDCSELVRATLEAFGKLDVVCNVAGILANGPTEDFPDDMWEQVLGVNLSGPFHISKRALPYLVETNGCIVNVASTAGLVGVPYGAAYSASKAGLIGLTRSLAAEFAKRGVRVNAVCPGHVLTPMTANAALLTQGAEPHLLQRLTPLTGRGSSAGEIAGAVAYLASDIAPNTTGTILTVDGGQTAI